MRQVEKPIAVLQTMFFKANSFLWSKEKTSYFLRFSMVNVNDTNPSNCKLGIATIKFILENYRTISSILFYIHTPKILADEWKSKVILKIVGIIEC